MTKVFLSYRREDSLDVTGRLHDHLEAHFGPDNVFMDLDTIPPGVDFHEHVVRAVKECDVLLAVIGERWLSATRPDGQRRLDDSKDFVRVEITSALRCDIPVIPILVSNARMPPPPELPAELRALATRQAVEVRSGQDFKIHVERLIHGIKSLQAPRKERAAGELHSIPINKAVRMTFAYIPPGTFLMGSPNDEPQRSDDETQHRVRLTKGYYLGTFPVTQAEWSAVMGHNPSRFKGPDRPVENVSWSDAVAFCETFSKQCDKRITLPTEAEWEHACRAATTILTPTSPGDWQRPKVASCRPGIFHFGDTISTDRANYDGSPAYGLGDLGEYRGETTPVNTFPANGWNLQDMHGNVWEWCQDWYGRYPEGESVDPEGPEQGRTRVLRGGSWHCGPERCRAAYRGAFDPGGVVHDFGFRVCLRDASDAAAKSKSRALASHG